MNHLRTALIGEALGTFILVFFGCASLASAVLTGAQVGIFQVAIVWGLGIALAIHVSAGLSGAHLNPAITLALATWEGFPWSRVGFYVAAQMIGAFLAAAVVHGLYAGAFLHYEALHSIIRGASGSEATAMVFGEFFPNPGGQPLSAQHPIVGIGTACGAEVLGTGLLMLAIRALTDADNPASAKGYAPAAIGLTVTLLICVFGPLTMACFNPARDFAPRLYSAWAGWGYVPFTVNGTGWFWVYIVSPMVGAWAGAGFYSKIIGCQHAGKSREGTAGRK